MNNSLLNFAKRMEQKAASLDEAASEIAKKGALAIVQDLMVHNPVDTSKAMSNWIVTLGAPSNEQIDAHVEGFMGSTKGASASETIARAKAVLAKKRPGQSIFITNSQPYIRRLNEGSSQQEPAGFVERAVLIGRKVIESSKVGDKAE